MLKKCIGCGYTAGDESTAQRAFCRDTDKSDGLRNVCRECDASARRERRERRKTPPSLPVDEIEPTRSSSPILATPTETRRHATNGQVALLGCVHRDDENDDLWCWAVDRLRAIRPVAIYLMGDFISCSPLSHWPRRTPEIKKYTASKVAAMRAMDDLLAFCGHIEYLEGNHEFWAREYVAAHPELDGHIDLPTDLGLAQRNIAWHDNDEPVVTPWGVLHHGNATKSGTTACRWYAEIYAPRFAFKKPVFIANWHHLGTYDAPSGAYCECTGYLGAFRPGYLKSSLPAWAPGFRVVDVEGGVVTKTVAHRYPA